MQPKMASRCASLVHTDVVPCPPSGRTEGSSARRGIGLDGRAGPAVQPVFRQERGLSAVRGFWGTKSLVAQLRDLELLRDPLKLASNSGESSLALPAAPCSTAGPGSMGGGCVRAVSPLRSSTQAEN